MRNQMVMILLYKKKAGRKPLKAKRPLNRHLLIALLVFE